MHRTKFTERPNVDARDRAYLESVERYKFANQVIGENQSGGHVLDLCCGPGHGTTHLSNAKKITAIDISAEAITQAKQFARPGTKVLQGNAEALQLKTQSISSVVCFEGLEHAQNGEKVLSEIHRVLKPGGIAIISTPNKAITSPNGPPPNPFHVREYTKMELMELLEKKFSSVAFLGHRAIKPGLLSKAISHPLTRGVYRALKPLIPKKIASGAYNAAYEQGVTEVKASAQPAILVAVCKK